MTITKPPCSATIHSCNGAVIEALTARVAQLEERTKRAEHMEGAVVLALAPVMRDGDDKTADMLATMAAQRIEQLEEALRAAISPDCMCQACNKGRDVLAGNRPGKPDGSD